MDHTADWWLGVLDDPWFKALESAVQQEWGIEPLRIREGGVSGCLFAIQSPKLNRRLLVYSFGPLSGKRIWVPRTPSSDGPKHGNPILVLILPLSLTFHRTKLIYPTSACH